MRRVVVTGLGAITPLGNNVNEYWNGIKDGKCGIDTIKQFDPSYLKAKLAAEVKNYNPDDHFDKKVSKRLDKFSQFAMVAAKEAMEDSKIDMSKINPERFGIIIGSGIGGFHTITNQHSVLLEKGPDRISPMFIPSSILNMAAGNIAIEYGLKGESYAITSACATGTHVIGEAYRAIKHGYEDMMMAGGTEASTIPLAIAGFINIKALNTGLDKARASIPFDKERSGFVLGEGSAILILEELEHAKKRNAKIYAEIVGYGATSDAYHITSPSPDGEGASRAMKLAMEEAGASPKDITYINAHGTGTPLNDKYETLAIKTALGNYSKSVMVSSTKGNIGHLMGAAGSIEAITCIKAMQDSFIPPTIGYKVPDEDCDLDIVANKGRKASINYAMSNSLGFGGHNVSLIFKKWEEA